MKQSKPYVPSYKLQVVDAFRQFFTGTLMPIFETIAMLVAIQYFQSSLWQKTFLVVLMNSGLLVGIPFAVFLSKRQWKIHSTLSVLYFAVGFFLGVLWLHHNYMFFLWCAFLVAIVTHGTHPIQSEIYGLWGKRSRGQRYLTSALAGIFGSLVGTLLYEPFTTGENMFSIFGLAAAFLLLAALTSTRLPKITFSKEQTINLKTMAMVLVKDKLFAYMCLAWFVLGAANLWLMGYRTNLFVEEQFGFGYSARTVLVLLVVVPEATRIVFAPLFGWLFDRMNFVLLRILLNLLLVAHALFVFAGTSLLHHSIGVFAHGLAMSGGAFAWRLWVNKMVAPSKVPLYMTIHSGLTGVRLVLAPLVGLAALEGLGPTTCGLISAFLMLGSAVMMLPVWRQGSRRFVH